MVFLFRQDSSRRQSLVSDSDPLLDQQVRASIDEDKTANLERNSSSRPIKRVTSSWASVPNKPQVIFLSLAAFTEFVYQSSARTYLFHQLRWFDPSLPDSTISTQAGIIQGCSKVVQVFSSIIVGRLADNASIGRKYMLLLGLLGYAFSSIGLAFSKTFLSAAIFQAAGGILDGNSALVRTVVAETFGDLAPNPVLFSNPGLSIPAFLKPDFQTPLLQIPLP
ncbi:major facilitator superfamily domain-containing protein [Penicillium verhagenii]|uniref:major facilitator superfamily domain-containing protein n=1 Tax=Penicillium verhagenii TaxID=1562060 RepID=UPI002544F71D|nr:major facilitator superfamily domain-containing protein [Penicillium verhagenii]KAJ5939677.1 major facilitator superfamily domain-containing protein [Penicillium verhagenii]